MLGKRNVGGKDKFAAIPSYVTWPFVLKKALIMLISTFYLCNINWQRILSWRPRRHFTIVYGFKVSFKLFYFCICRIVSDIRSHSQEYQDCTEEILLYGNKILRGPERPHTPAWLANKKRTARTVPTNVQYPVDPHSARTIRNHKGRNVCGYETTGY